MKFVFSFFVGLGLALFVILLLNACATTAAMGDSLGEGCTPPPQVLNGPVLMQCNESGSTGRAECMYFSTYRVQDVDPPVTYECRFFTQRMTCKGDWLLAGAVCSDTAPAPEKPDSVKL
jgi:hypothetical protein